MENSINNKLYEFIDILRDANVYISVDEVLSLFNALPGIPMEDEVIFKQAIKTTLIKDYTDIPVFEKCFDEFFKKIGDDTEAYLKKMHDHVLTRKMAKHLKPVVEEKIDQLEIEVNSFVDGLGQEALMKISPENILNLFMEEMESSGSSGGLGMMLFKNKRGDMPSMHERPDELPDGAEIDIELRNLILNIISKKLSRKKFGTQLKEREDFLLNKFLYQLTPEEIKEMREIVKRFGQKLKNRITLRKKRVKHGKIDIKRTIRTSLQYGGVPFRIFFKDKKIDRPQLAILCDVSGSVNQYTRFMLLLTYTLQELFSKVRTFAFISNMVEITDKFREMNPERAINSIFDDTDFTFGWGSNYGKCFTQFIENHSDSLSKKTTVLVLGDARNNHQDPGMESFIRIKEKSKNLFWLNPEKQHLWDWSDSIATYYQKYCTEMKEVNNFLDLSEFIDKLFIGHMS